MIILSANNLGKVYGTDVIIEKASFHVNAGDRVGIVGRNGAGKTTLLNMLTGEFSVDEGEFFVSSNTRVGYLKQRDNFFKDHTVIQAIEDIFSHIHALEEEIHKTSDMVAANPQDERLIHKLDALQQEYDAKGGYTYKSEITGILSSMAFGTETYNKKISTLSGGERTRLALAALLLEKPDLLLLDEPTNHLDIGTLKWLEQYLSSYKGTIMIVSHDRYFLDQTVNRIFEVENHKVYCYEGNYTAFAAKKAQRREAELRAYTNQQKEIARQEEMIRRFKQHGTELLAKRAQSREKRLEHIERLERPESEMGRMKIHFRQNFQSGNDVIFAEGLAKDFGWGSSKKELFRNVNLDIKRGERICIVGPNGVGKTTLLRTLLGELNPTDGRLKIGHNVAFGYYDQGQQLLNNNNTVLEELKESYRLYTDTEMRNILGRFLFHGDDVFLPVGSLSGGEKARLSLVKMMLSGANTLILDEPTNHLDIDSKEVFEEALLEFPGTVIVVSHDRYFLQRIPTRILELENDGINEYLGKYDYYLEKKEQIQSAKKYLTEQLGGGAKGAVAADLDHAKAVVEAGQEVMLSAAEQRALNKQREAEERRKARALAKIEEEIAALEEENAEIEAKMCSEENMNDYELLTALSTRHEEVAKLLEEAYEQWAIIDEQ
ncbi:MAG: ABC-F family ATP-binding cassette domain-containing protein [Firmicutes bacterium]|nr:ABC-F family ATP-binding cassette domain-containing protein [Bacillota bacterium]